MVVLDYDTVAGADKFGNIFVSRLPAQVSDEVEEDPTGKLLNNYFFLKKIIIFLKRFKIKSGTRIFKWCIS